MALAYGTYFTKKDEAKIADFLGRQDLNAAQTSAIKAWHMDQIGKQVTFWSVCSMILGAVLAWGLF